jgi:succinyl-diaminopimelate desuccinylase
MRFDKYIDSNRDAIIKNTQEILRFKSTESEPVGEMPYGEEVHKCLTYTLDLCNDFGFTTKNVDNYAGHAEIGNGDDTFGILVHLDVVPEGDGWDFDPYGGIISENRIYGRGALDDKGPTIAAIYAMKALKDSDVQLNKKIRIIFGTNEETGWGGIEHYMKKEPMPEAAFTPDADFPVIHGEMGILVFDLVKKFDETLSDGGIKVLGVSGGTRPNMVPDYAEAKFVATKPYKDILEAYMLDNDVRFEAEEDEDIVTVKSFGLSAHGSTPEKGKNAISHLLCFLDCLDLAIGDMANLIRFYGRTIKTECNGQNIGCHFEDEFGKLVFNVGVIDLNEDQGTITVNVRYPITGSDEDVISGIKKIISENMESIKVTNIKHTSPIYLPKDSDLIKTLMNVYTEYTGDTSEPITIGGGTYARALKNAVAFGPLFPGDKDTIHQKNEYIEIENLIKMTKIYAAALYELTK